MYIIYKHLSIYVCVYIYTPNPTNAKKSLIAARKIYFNTIEIKEMRETKLSEKAILCETAYEGNQL
jgi:hypothetical protein